MDHGHIVNQFKHSGLVTDNTLHVIGVCSNPVRWHSRYRLARAWIEEMVGTPCVELHVVEAAFGDRFHELKDLCQTLDVSYLPLHIKSSIWIKENLINLGVKHLLPTNWKYVAWIDMDVFFRDKGWAQETLQQLQHFEVVQPWSDAIDLGPLGNVLQAFKSFGLQHQKGVPKQKHPSQPYIYAHTGFAVAATKLFWENALGLPDFCILGSADHHLLFACIGEVRDTIHGKMSEGFHRRLKEWEARVIRITQAQVGFVPGRIEHFFHGNKKKRYYRERWAVLYENEFDPDRDLMYDSQGIIKLIGKPKLELEIHKYNLSRHEDGTDE